MGTLGWTMPAAPASDAAIIERSLEDPAAFAEVFDRHYDAIHRFLWARVGQAAEDLTAEVFRVAFERRDAYDVAYASAKPWLFGIASNIAKQHHRTKARRRELRARLGATREHQVEPSPEQRLQELSPSSTVAAALTDLAPRDRDALLLHAWADLDYADTARALEVPLGTVRSRLHRARKVLRDRLGSPEVAVDADGAHGGEGGGHG